MARTIRSRDLAPTLGAYQHWIDRCLVGDGSVFTDRALWTGANVEEVRRAFVDNPDEGKDDFSTKLKGQMKGASAEAQRLMAEMLWALLIFPTNVAADTKRRQVRDLWALSGDELPATHPLLADQILAGIGSAGPGFNNHRWRELRFLIVLTNDLKRKSEPQRQQILSNYDAFMPWIGGLPEEGNRQFRHMLRYAAFPDRVERMSSNRHRHEILDVLAGIPEAETQNSTDRQLDDALLELRRNLEAESPSAVLDFYEKPLSSRWKSRDDSDVVNDDKSRSGVRYWVEKTLTHDRADRLQGEHALGRALWSPQRDQRGADIYRFMREVRPGDVVLHLTDNSGFTGVSVAASVHH